MGLKFAGLNLTAADYIFILNPWWNPLQKTKKDLAESIVSEDHDFMKKLKKEDLEMLLGQEVLLQKENFSELRRNHTCK